MPRQQIYKKGMYKLEDFPDNSKVWIYQSEEEFSVQQVKLIAEKSGIFLGGWESHGKPVKGFIEVYHNRFITIVADDEGGRFCGRAMDGSVRFIKELETELGISLMNRMLVSYKQDDKIRCVPLPEFQNLIVSGTVDSSTIVFNNLVEDKGAFLNSWEVALENSWHKQFISA